LDSYADYESVFDASISAPLMSGETGPYKTLLRSETGARRFSTLFIDGLQNGKSPLWLRRRLFVVGAGIRNLLVDASNYILHECGQPNHAYDPALLKGEILSVRKALEGESFTALDDIEYQLDADDIVIADEEGALALAGIIGGSHCSVRD